MRTVEERFWSKVAIGDVDACWPWTRGRYEGGYGQFRVRPGESPRKASRIAWTLSYGASPGRMQVCHRCDNPPCCNPAHLFLGTHQDNMADMAAKGRAAVQRPAARARFVVTVRRLTDDQLTEARCRVLAGESRRSVALGLGVAHTTISRLLTGEHWARPENVTPNG